MSNQEAGKSDESAIIDDAKQESYKYALRRIEWERRKLARV
jgi:hypothetical protein